MYGDGRGAERREWATFMSGVNCSVKITFNAGSYSAWVEHMRGDANDAAECPAGGTNGLKEHEQREPIEQMN